MRRFNTCLFLVFAVSSSYCQQMLVTDFVFFNNFDSPFSANIPNFFNSNPEELAKLQSRISDELAKKYSLEKVSFDPKSTKFQTKDATSKAYADNHKKLIKEGGFEYYLRLFSEVSLTTLTNNRTEYTFDIQSRVSDKKGKKVDRPTAKIVFTASFTPDSINSSNLLSEKDFFEVFNACISGLFSENVDKVLWALNRGFDTQFDSFLSSSQRYEIHDYKSKNPSVVGLEGEAVVSKVRGGIDNDSDISDGGQVLVGELEDKITSLGIKNPKLAEWRVSITPKKNKTFEGLGLAPSGDLTIRIENTETAPFRLLNGKLTGEIQKQTFLVTLEPSAQLVRVFINGELAALAQPIGDERGKKQKLFYTGSEINLHQVTNLLQIHHRTLAALETLR